MGIAAKHWKWDALAALDWNNWVKIIYGGKTYTKIKVNNWFINC